MQHLLKDISAIRKQLLNTEKRKEFWKRNKKETEKNVQKVMHEMKLPKGWKIYTTVHHFLGKEKTNPYDNGSWSAMNIIGATKAQGYELLLFLNTARISFLSASAMIPLITHEIWHAHQAANNPKQFLNSITNDKISQLLEKKADMQASKINDEFRKEYILESILYCHDAKGWKDAEAMAHYLCHQIVDRYGGGYKEIMTKKEHKIFLEAKKKKNIQLFIKNFL